MKIIQFFYTEVEIFFYNDVCFGVSDIAIHTFYESIQFYDLQEHEMNCHCMYFLDSPQ